MQQLFYEPISLRYFSNAVWNYYPGPTRYKPRTEFIVTQFTQDYGLLVYLILIGLCKCSNQTLSTGSMVTEEPLIFV